MQEDWTSDSRGDGYVDKGEFMDSMFEVADMWCETCNKQEYVDTLKQLWVKIFRKVPPLNWKLRNLAVDDSAELAGGAAAGSSS